MFEILDNIEEFFQDVFYWSSMFAKISLIFIVSFFVIFFLSQMGLEGF